MNERGTYRFVTVAGDASQHAFSGTYRFIQAPHHLVYTERYEQIPGAESVVSVHLDEAAGQTLLTEEIEYPSAAAREGHIASGMEHGLRAAFERLENLLR